MYVYQIIITTDVPTGTLLDVTSSRNMSGKQDGVGDGGVLGAVYILPDDGIFTNFLYPIQGNHFIMSSAYPDKRA